MDTLFGGRSPLPLSEAGRYRSRAAVATHRPVRSDRYRCVPLRRSRSSVRSTRVQHESPGSASWTRPRSASGRRKKTTERRRSQDVAASRRSPASLCAAANRRYGCVCGWAWGKPGREWPLFTRFRVGPEGEVQRVRRRQRVRLAERLGRGCRTRRTAQGRPRERVDSGE
jgi:hypothetical protein